MSDSILRQWEMLKLIPRDRKITVKELHTKLENMGYSVTRRTLERDLDRLSGPFCLESDTRSKPYGWRYSVNMKFPSIPSLTSSEALTLIMLESHLKNVLPVAVTDNLSAQFAAARHFFSEKHPDLKLQDWLNKVEVLPPGQPLMAPEIDSSIQRVLYEALLLNQQLEMTYLNINSSDPKHYNSVNLQGLVQYGVVIYLVATINDYQDPRLLALHRVRSVSIKSDDIAQIQGFDLKQYIKDGAFGFGELSKSIKVYLKFYNAAGNHLAETKLSEDQAIDRIDSETLTLTATVLDTSKFVWWLTAFGPDVEVIEPQALRKVISERHQKAAQYYLDQI